MRDSVGLAIVAASAVGGQVSGGREILPDIDVPKYRKFAEDVIEAQFERVPGVAGANVRGGEARQTASHRRTRNSWRLAD